MAAELDIVTTFAHVGDDSRGAERPHCHAAALRQLAQRRDPYLARVPA